MTPEEERELNEKLARWAGFECIAASLYKWPNGGTTTFLPDFTRSLDACFQWLVPKLQEGGCGFFFSDSQGKPPYLFSIYKYDDEDGEFLACNANTDTPALALCLAVDKLEKGSD